MAQDQERYLIETIAMGAFARVAAIDPATGLEAVVSGPVDAPALLERLAVRKLRRMLAAQAPVPAAPASRGRIA